MEEIRELEPKEVFQYFEKICEIPHGSGNTDAISEFVVDFAADHELDFRQDEVGNVIIWKAATPGREGAKGLILQGHLDMVAVKDETVHIDLEHDPVPVETDGTFVFANGTSLGADDGIAVAMILAILASDSISHPALTAILTVGEEIGMIGAEALDTEGITARTMVNIDSEEEDAVIAGCAGGATVQVRFPADSETVSGFVAHLQFSGLTGGHSGEEIHKERLNANALFGRFLSDAPENLTIRFGELSGGKKDNAIAQNFSAVLVVPEEDKDELLRYMDQFREMIMRENGATDPDAALLLRPVGIDKAEVIRSDQAVSIGAALAHLPNGVMRRIPGMTDMVETSLNLGVVRKIRDVEDNSYLQLTYCVRSSSDSQKNSLISRIRELSAMFGGVSRVTGVYPAWEYRQLSELRDALLPVYQMMTGNLPKVKAIHAGVECGIFGAKIPDLDCVSIGPDIFDIHTTKERMSIVSVRRIWSILLELLRIWE